VCTSSDCPSALKLLLLGRRSGGRPLMKPTECVLQRVVSRFYGGSAEDLVQGLVDGRMIDRRALERLAARVSAAERSRRAGNGDE
jgi:hypothetical protein